MIRGCDWVGFFLLAFALTSLVVALPPWLLLLSLVNLFYAKATSTHLLVRVCLPCTAAAAVSTPYNTPYHCLYSSLLPSPLLFLHTQHFSDMVSFLDSAITCVIALICGIVLLWVVSGTCRTLTRKGRRKKKERIDSTQVALLDHVGRV